MKILSINIFNLYSNRAFLTWLVSVWPGVAIITYHPMQCGLSLHIGIQIEIIEQ